MLLPSIAGVFTLPFQPPCLSYLSHLFFSPILFLHHLLHPIHTLSSSLFPFFPFSLFFNPTLSPPLRFLLRICGPLISSLALKTGPNMSISSALYSATLSTLCLPSPLPAPHPAHPAHPARLTRLAYLQIIRTNLAVLSLPLSVRQSVLLSVLQSVLQSVVLLVLVSVAILI